MSDPIQDLENFNSEGLPVNPLAPSEVRRLGDRMRRRRNAAAVVAGVAAVAVIAAPIALFAGRDNSSSPSPAPSPTENTSAPDVVVTTPPTPHPIHSLIKEIPAGFPLAAAWPDDSQAESEKDGLTGPNRTLDSLLFTACGKTFEDPEYVDRLRAEWTNPEDYRDRQLTTYVDADAAAAAVSALTDFWRACPTEDSEDGYTRKMQVVRTEQGDESWAMIQHLELNGEGAIGLQVVHVIRLGRAVLINSEAGEGMAPSPGSDVERIVDAIAATTAEPLSKMCAFTAAGCGDGDGPIEAPVFGTIGPEGFRGVELGMSLDEALAAGAEVTPEDPGGACRPITTQGGAHDSGLGVAVSDKLGVAGFFFKPGIKTPEGIGIGSTLEQWTAAYPESSPPSETGVAAPVPGHPDRQYFAFFDRDNRVVEMTLELNDQDCYR